MPETSERSRRRSAWREASAPAGGAASWEDEPSKPTLARGGRARGERSPGVRALVSLAQSDAGIAGDPALVEHPAAVDDQRSARHPREQIRDPVELVPSGDQHRRIRSAEG